MTVAGGTAAGDTFWTRDQARTDLGAGHTRRHAPRVPGPPVAMTYREVSEQAREDLPQGLLAVRMGAVVHGQHGDGHAGAVALEQNHLVVEQASSVTPPALEVFGPPTLGQLSDSPTLGGDDRGEQMHGVVAMARCDIPIDVKEEPGLVSCGDLGLTPDRSDRFEVGHAHPVSEGIQASAAHDLVDTVGRVIVRRGDHRSQKRLVGRAQPTAGDTRSIKVGDHQHRFDHAGRPLHVIGPVAVEAVVRTDRERDVPDATVGVRHRGLHVGMPELTDRPPRAGHETSRGCRRRNGVSPPLPIGSGGRPDHQNGGNQEPQRNHGDRQPPVPARHLHDFCPPDDPGAAHVGRARDRSGWSGGLNHLLDCRFEHRLPLR